MEEKKKTTETIGIIGFICSFIVPFIGLILSIIGISRACKNNSAKGLPIAGLIISIIRIVLRIFIISLIVKGALFGINNADKIGGTITGKWDDFCQKAEKCEKTEDGFYNCEYKNTFFEFTIPCSEEQIHGENTIDSENFDLDDIMDYDLTDDLNDIINID